jgi:hypothetical protein
VLTDYHDGYRTGSGDFVILLYMEFDSRERSHHEKIEELLKENQRLLIENNTLLRKMRRTAIISSLLRFLWFVVLLGTGAYTYYTYIQPNLETIKAKVTELDAVMIDPSAIKGLYDDFRTKDTANQ